MTQRQGKYITTSAFPEPNYTQTPNNFFDMLPDMEHSEVNVTLVMIRHTFGFHRSEFKMSISKLAAAAGLSRNAAKDGAEAAERRGTFRRANPDAQTEAEWELIVGQSEDGQPVTPLIEWPADGQSVTPIGQPVTIDGSTNDSQVGVKEIKEIKNKEKEGARGMKNPNTGNRTDAVVKGDVFDGLVHFAAAGEAQALASGISVDMLDRLNEYPEDVRFTLKIISSLCSWLPVAIPSSKNKSQFELWIVELREINMQLGGTGEKGLNAAYKVFKDWTVARPGAILAAVKSEAGKVSKTDQASAFTGVQTPFAQSLNNRTPKDPETEKRLKSMRDKLQRTRA